VSEEDLYVGLISGTSRDGVDAVLVRFTENHPDLLARRCEPYAGELADQLERLVRAGQRPCEADLQILDSAVAHHFADTALRLLDDAGFKAAAVRALGSHGQTVWHAPDEPEPESIQLGRPALIAELTGIPTVGDFRRADLEAGGQGAPLAPLLHRALFRPARGKRVVLNLGGIANVSVVDAGGGVRGFDTGPANCLLDAWISDQRGVSFDRDGSWAATGRVDPELLRDLLADQWFGRAPPKSTGVEYFNLAWVRRHLANCQAGPADIQATLAELTAVSIADAVRLCGADDLLLCGGGSHNVYLRNRLASLLPQLHVASTADFGLEPDWVEAVLFAWLARERLAGHAQDTRAITGARKPVLLGSIAYPPGVEYSP
jgi:anhydro-N-acetylmuramic acid kinase